VESSLPMEKPLPFSSVPG